MTTSARTDAASTRRAGFTLIEMLAVIMVMAVLFAMALPLLKGPPDRLQLAEAANRVRNAMLLGREMAITSNRDGVVAIDTASGTLSSAVGTTRLSGVRADLVVADSERRSTSIGAIRFFADGSSTGGSVTLRLHALRSRIFVDWMTGRATIREGTDED